MSIPEREEIVAGLRKLKGPSSEVTDKEVDMYYKALSMWHRSQMGPVPIHTMIAIVLLLEEFGEGVVKSKPTSQAKAKVSA